MHVTKIYTHGNIKEGERQYDSFVKCPDCPRKLTKEDYPSIPGNVTCDCGCNFDCIADFDSNGDPV